MKHLCPDCKQEIFPQIYSDNPTWLEAVCKNSKHKYYCRIFVKNDGEKKEDE